MFRGFFFVGMKWLIFLVFGIHINGVVEVSFRLTRHLCITGYPDSMWVLYVRDRDCHGYKVIQLGICFGRGRG